MKKIVLLLVVFCLIGCKKKDEYLEIDYITIGTTAHNIRILMSYPPTAKLIGKKYIKDKDFIKKFNFRIKNSKPKTESEYYEPNMRILHHKSQGIDTIWLDLGYLTINNVQLKDPEKLIGFIRNEIYKEELKELGWKHPE